MQFHKILTKDFKDENDFIQSGFFQISLEERNLLTLVYVFRSGLEEFYVKRGRIFIDVEKKHIKNINDSTWICTEYVDGYGNLKTIPLCELENKIEVEIKIDKFKF